MLLELQCPSSGDALRTGRSPSLQGKSASRAAAPCWSRHVEMFLATAQRTQRGTDGRFSGVAIVAVLRETWAMNVAPARNRLGLVAICFVVLLALAPWVWGQNTDDMLAQARDLVQQASGTAGNKPSDTERIKLLTQAIQLAQQAPQHNLKGHRVLAIQNLRVAITLLRDGDPQGQLPGYFKSATSELSAAISLAEKNDAAKAVDSEAMPATNAPPIVPLPPATNAPSIVPLPPATNVPPIKPVADALPPGVTVEMEQDFLARFQAALQAAKGAKDESGLDPYVALYAMDPAVDAKGKDAFRSMVIMGFGLGAMGKNPTYSFAPLPAEGDSKDETPTQLGDKMYVGYLPPVAIFKTTFAPSSGDEMVPRSSEEPLCIQKGRLMLIGVKEVPGAVPPPMDNAAENYGLSPKHLASEESDDEFSNEFDSLEAFLAALKQPGLEVVASGQTDFTFCAVCRVHTNLLVYAFAGRRGKDDYFDTVQVTDAQGNLVNAEKKEIALVEEPKPGIDGKAIDYVSGTVFKLLVGYAGPIRVEAKYWEEDEKHPSTFSTTVDWK